MGKAVTRFLQYASKLLRNDQSKKTAEYMTSDGLIALMEDGAGTCLPYPVSVAVFNWQYSTDDAPVLQLSLQLDTLRQCKAQTRIRRKDDGYGLRIPHIGKLPGIDGLCPGAVGHRDASLQNKQVKPVVYAWTVSLTNPDFKDGTPDTSDGHRRVHPVIVSLKTLDNLTRHGAHTTLYKA